MKKYVITGATSGIGKALVKELSKENIVFAGYRNSNKLEELIGYSENIIPFYIDMTDSMSIKWASEFIKNKTNRIDTLINVAGCVVAGPVENLEISELRRQFEVNTFSHLDLTQKLMPLLKGGKIINMSSMASFGLFPFISPYCASKRALDIFFNALEIETDARVKVISIKPGVIATPLWGKSIDENMPHLQDNKNYTREMNFLTKNAMKNEKKGLSVDKVVEVVKKVDSLKNPRVSYTVGKDAFMAELFSKLPQTLLNKMVRFGLNARIN